MEKVLVFRIEAKLDCEAELNCEEMEIKVNKYLDKGWTVKDVRIDRGITVFVLDGDNATEPESDAEYVDYDYDMGWH